MKYNINSLKTKILLMMIGISFLISFFLILNGISSQENIVKLKENDILSNTEKNIYKNIEARLESIETPLTVIIENPQVQELFANRDSERLNLLLQPAFIELQKIGINNGHFHTPDSVTVLRLHKPEHTGDDLSAFRFIVNDANNEIAMFKGIEEGKNGLFLRVIKPLSYEGEHTGTFEMGSDFGANFLDILKHDYGGEYFIYLFKEDSETAGRLYSNTSEDSYALPNEEQVASIKAGNIVKYSSIDDASYIILMPLKDYSSKIIGYYKAAVSKADINQLKEKYHNQNIMILVVLISFILVISIFMANSITKPINKLTDAGNRIANGDLEVEMPTIKTKDEIKDLSDTMNLLVGAIKYLKSESNSKKKKKK